MPGRLPIIVAHRGVHHSVDENSLDAFLAAVDLNLPWVECDVWSSSDGVPVVMHDATLDRTTAGTGPVSQYTRDDLRLVNVPALADVLEILPAQMGILVEIKAIEDADLVWSVADQLKQFSGSWMIQSFDAMCYAFAVFSAGVERAAILFENAAALQVAIDTEYPNIHARHDLIDREMVEHLHNQGGKIGAWTVNKPADILRMIDLGVDMLITDDPELAMQLLATR